MNKIRVVGVLFLGAGTLIFNELAVSHKPDVVLNSHSNEHLPEEPRPEGTTRTSLDVTIVSTAATTTTTTAPYF